MLRRALRSWNRSVASLAVNGAVDRSQALPAIPLSEFSARRDRLKLAVNTLPDMASFQRHVFILPAAEVKYKSHHVPYTFHQDANFRYLCGFPEAEAALLLSLELQSEGPPRAQLFVKSRPKEQEVWDGPALGLEGAKLFGTDGVHDVEHLQEVLTQELADSSKTAVWFEHDHAINSYLRQPIMRIVADTEAAVFNPSSVIDLMRVVKTPAELACMREAARVAGEAITETMRFCGQQADSMSEFRLWAKVEFESRMRGCPLAYPPVVGGGTNANIIHYLTNSAPLRPDQLVLMDAGSQCDGYVSDITRTWPVSGRFTEHQRVLYEVTLHVLERCFERVTREASLNRLYHFMLAEIGRQTKAAGIIRRSSRLENEAEIGRKLCPHHIGHWLGLDVHDTPSVPTSLELMPGVVFPLEPGIYVPEECDFVASEFHGMGVRVEDDVAMTEAGPEILSAGCPKSVSDIEELMT